MYRRGDSKEREPRKDRDRERDRERDRDKDREKEREKHRRRSRSPHDRERRMYHGVSVCVSVRHGSIVIVNCVIVIVIGQL